MLVIAANDFKGRGVKAFLPFFYAKFRLYQREEIYKAYTADCLRCISENTAKQCKDGSYIKRKYLELFKRESTKTGEEILREVCEKGGITIS